MSNKKPPNFSTHFEPETLQQIDDLQQIKSFLTSKKAILAYCVSIVHTLEKKTIKDKENA